AQRRWPARVWAREQFEHVRHIIEHVTHVLRRRANATEKILSFFVEFVRVIGEKELAESVDREDRRFQIVRQHAEKSEQLFLRQRVFRFHEAYATATTKPGDLSPSVRCDLPVPDHMRGA